MKEIINFKLFEFLQQKSELIEKYLNLLQFINPVKTEREVFHMKFKHVERIKDALTGEDNEELLKVIAKVQKCSIEDLMQYTIIDFFGVVNSVRKQVEKINDAEDRLNGQGAVNVKWQMVRGSEQMAIFGVYNTLEYLASGDITKYKQIENMEYAEVFTVLRMKQKAEQLRQEMDNIKLKGI